jgi:hypothetical protein
VFTLNLPELGHVMVNDRIREADRRRLRVTQHRVQRERVRSSLILRPEPRSADR